MLCIQRIKYKYWKRLPTIENGDLAEEFHEPTNEAFIEVFLFRQKNLGKFSAVFLMEKEKMELRNEAKRIYLQVQLV